ncbi:MAG: TonB-dependent receptor [Candidatus Marinimicrobia bacterium]|nr:TonB-dependent receptor [Candidatus Neomarinimicrobiota bacterium]
MNRILQIATIFLVPIFLYSQEVGKIAGQVTDESTGNPLVGANVQVEGTSFGAATDADGKYVILGIDPGVYTLDVGYIGYQSIRLTDLRVLSRLTTETDVALAAQAIQTEAVNVVAQRALIIRNATSAVRSLGSDQIANFATRNVKDIWNTQAGVVLQNDMLHIRGSRPDEVGYEIEGAPVRSLFVGGVTQLGGRGNNVNNGGGSAFNLGTAIPNAIEEVSLQMGGYSADIGGANAGIVQQKLKTGGSSLSGSVLFETEGLAEAFNGVLSGGDTYDYGGRETTVTLGGPITSKIRFFGAYQTIGTDDYAPQFWNGANISGLDLYPDSEGALFDRVPGGQLTEDSVFIAWDGGLVQGRRSDRTTINSTLLFDFNPLILRVSFSNTSSETILNSLPIRNLFNVNRLTLRDEASTLITGKLTYFLSAKTLINLNFNSFDYTREFYDRNFGKPESFMDGQAWGDSAKVVAMGMDKYGEDWSGAFTGPFSFERPYLIENFEFARAGDLATPGFANSGPSKFGQSYIGFGLGLNSQVGAHELKLGFDARTYTIRRYRFLGVETINGQLDPKIATLTEADIENKTEAARVAIRRAFVKNIGYDEFGDEVGDSDIDGPRHPTTTSLYINDKIEMNDIVVNVGVRYDILDLNDFTHVDPFNPKFNKGKWYIDEDGLEDSEPIAVVQPRLGLAFPLSDKSVFHLQYGVFAQLPDLGLPYKGRADMATSLNGQNFIRDPLGFDLEPVITTQYEVGLSYQFVDDAAVDVTAFTRNTTGQLVLARLGDIGVDKENTYGVDATSTTYINGDFSVATGVELSVTTRRIGRLQVLANYTFTDARGTNSFPNSAVGNLSNTGLSAPSLISPLTFQQRHKGTLNLDYRYGPGEGGLLASSAINLLFNFNSGHPYTRATGSGAQRGPDEGGLLNESDPRSRQPIEPLGASVTPWVFLTDMRVTKGLNFGGVKLDAYLLINNLFNQQNIINVYNRTGDAFDDGFLTTPALSEKLLANNSPVYEELYRVVNLEHREHFVADIGLDLFGRPRQIKFGLEVSF